ncbi:MAG: ABC transporter permease [Tepidisphaeraceae bacterium]
MLAPLLLWVLLLVVVPTVIMVVFSFSDRGNLGEIVYRFSLDNYRRIAEGAQWTPLLVSLGISVVAVGLYVLVRRGNRGGWLAVFVAVFWTAINVAVFTQSADAIKAQWLKVSVISINYAAGATALCVLLGYPAAYFIGRAPERWRNLLVLAVTIPFWTSFLVRTYAWVTIFSSEGLLNTTLTAIGWPWLMEHVVNPAFLKLHLIAEPFPLKPELYPSQTAVMVGLVYAYLPFMILPIYTSVERLDKSLIEAALDLGATPFRTFTRVILPLTMPGVIAGIVLTFVPAIGMFAVNDILGGRQEMLIGNVIERQFTAARDKPFGSALGMILLVLFIATYALTLRRKPSEA